MFRCNYNHSQVSSLTNQESSHFRSHCVQHEQRIYLFYMSIPREVVCQFPKNLLTKKLQNTKKVNSAILLYCCFPFSRLIWKCISRVATSIRLSLYFRLRSSNQIRRQILQISRLISKFCRRNKMLKNFGDHSFCNVYCKFWKNWYVTSWPTVNVELELTFFINVTSQTFSSGFRFLDRAPRLKTEDYWTYIVISPTSSLHSTDIFRDMTTLC